jgi:hypothetical protein
MLWTPGRPVHLWHRLRRSQGRAEEGAPTIFGHIPALKVTAVYRSGEQMRFAMMIPAFLAYVSVISRFFLNAEERRRVSAGFIVLGLIGVVCYVIYSAYRTVDDRGFVQVNRHHSALREILGQLESVPAEAARLMQAFLGPQGMVLGLVLACVLLGGGVILFLLHKNAADPD